MESDLLFHSDDDLVDDRCDVASGGKPDCVEPDQAPTVDSRKRITRSQIRKRRATVGPESEPKLRCINLDSSDFGGKSPTYSNMADGNSSGRPSTPSSAQPLSEMQSLFKTFADQITDNLGGKIARVGRQVEDVKDDVKANTTAIADIKRNHKNDMEAILKLCMDKSRNWKRSWQLLTPCPGPYRPLLRSRPRPLQAQCWITHDYDVCRRTVVFSNIRWVDDENSDSFVAQINSFLKGTMEFDDYDMGQINVVSARRQAGKTRDRSFVEALCSTALVTT